MQINLIIFSAFKILFIFRDIFRGRWGRKRGRETSMRGCLLCVPYWGPALQPRHVPWLGINCRPFGSQAGAQSTKPHQPGLNIIISLGNIPKGFEHFFKVCDFFLNSVLDHTRYLILKNWQIYMKNISYLFPFWLLTRLYLFLIGNNLSFFF